jgi:phytoene dehydrogenase-like protein
MAAYDTLVIGAGFSGLAAGIRCAMFGQRVAVLERHYLWGGLNSFYKRGGRLFDTGLHALTNVSSRGVRGTPLGRLLRQLRIPPDALTLLPQRESEVVLAERRVRFSQDPAQWIEGVTAEFPHRADAFRALHEELAATDTDSIAGPGRSARALLEQRLGDPALVDLVLMPTCFYASARQDDIDWDQFVVLYRALFVEGMAQPAGGIRPLLALLVDRLREAGGELVRKAEVDRILVEDGHAIGVRLADGREITARYVLSSAGWVETASLVGADFAREHVRAGDVGRITILETISVLDRAPARIAGPRPLDAATVFFCTEERFRYRAPEALYDTTHGVLSMPTNFGRDEDWVGHEPTLRVTLLAHPERWHGLPEDEYGAAKRAASDAALARTAALYSDPRPHEVFRDVFSPRTITKYTAHRNGALYGSPSKRRDGTTPIDGLHLIGADQGFSGIVGAALSGVAVANRRALASGSPV